MRRLCVVLAAALLAGGAVPASGAAALAAPTPAPSQKPAAVPSPAASPEAQLAALSAQLDSEQARLNELNDQVERAQAQLDVLNRKLTADQQREADLTTQLMALGRVEYEEPALSLTSILQATSLDQLLANVAQARLVAGKQRTLLSSAKALRQQDQIARDGMSVQLATVQSSRDDAAAVADQTLSMRNSIQSAAMKARADALAAQARATQAPTQTGRGSPAGPWPNHFSFGYCTWFVATKRYVPWFGNANQWYVNAQPYGFPEGQTPKVGAIMVTNESSFGHVAYVTAVNADGSWTVQEMNYTAWDVVDTRTIHPGQVPLQGFIYQ